MKIVTYHFHYMGEINKLKSKRKYLSSRCIVFLKTDFRARKTNCTRFTERFPTAVVTVGSVLGTRVYWPLGGLSGILGYLILQEAGIWFFNGGQQVNSGWNILQEVKAGNSLPLFFTVSYKEIVPSDDGGPVEAREPQHGQSPFLQSRSYETYLLNQLTISPCASSAASNHMQMRHKQVAVKWSRRLWDDLIH